MDMEVGLVVAKEEARSVERVFFDFYGRDLLTHPARFLLAREESLGFFILFNF